MTARPGPSTVADAKRLFGRHALLGLSVRPSGDRWWAVEQDPGGYEGRHRAIRQHPFVQHRGDDRWGCGLNEGDVDGDAPIRCGFYRQHHPTMVGAL